MTQTPRILAIIGSRVLYGQERANLLVLETLQSHGCKVLAVVEDHPAFRVMSQELKKRGIPFIEAPIIGRRIEGYLIDFLLGTPVRLLRLRRKLRRVVRDWRPTHIHVPNPFAFLMADVIAPPGIPIIYRIGDQPSVHNTYWRWIWRRIVGRVTLFVADSEFIAKSLHSLGVDPRRIRIIFTPPSTRSTLPQPHAVPTNPRSMVFLGQLTQNKGVDRLVSAFCQIAPDFSEAQLTIIGRISDWHGDDWQRCLRNSVAANPGVSGRIFFVGEQENIYKHLASAAFLVAPSVWEEPFGLVVGEAKAAARPSVVFPSGGLPEQISHGEDGFICRDKSIEALAEGLRYYLSDPDRAREHGRNALASLDRLGAGQFARQWRNFYDAVMPDSGAFQPTEAGMMEPRRD